MSSLPPAKHQKKNEDDLICPINLNLPLDPVIAEDGQVYERNAIEQYIKSNHGGELKSPITREKMGTKLLGALNVKNTIETMIENSAITGEPAEDWKRRVKQKKNMEDLLEKAEGGDAKAMERVADGYNWAENGFIQDYKLAYKWYQKAHLAGSTLRMAKEGDLLFWGHGVAKDVITGMTYLGMAEGRGSDLAASILGYHMADGRHGVPVNKAMAQQLLEKSLSGYYPRKDMNEKGKREAQGELDKLVNQQ